MLTVILAIIAVYYLLELLECWVPLLAWRFGKARTLPPPSTYSPQIEVVIPCRDGASDIPGLAVSLGAQTYTGRWHCTLIADNCRDHSAVLARSLGMNVYERRNPDLQTKGAAIGEWLLNVLRFRRFDALLILDVDSRISADFLERAAKYFCGDGLLAVQSEHRTRNVGTSALTQIGEMGEILSRIQQRGRDRLGWPALFSGSGMILSRKALKRLDWRLSRGTNLGDDLEANARCYLKEIPIRYDEDLLVHIDLPEAAHGIQIQRRRWTAAIVELMQQYVWPLASKAASGDWLALEALFGFLFLAPFSILFITIPVMAGLWVGLGPRSPGTSPWLILISLLWTIHGLYYFAALTWAKYSFSGLRPRALWRFLRARVWAMFDASALLARSGNRWTPTPHRSLSEEDRDAAACSDQGVSL